MNVNKKLDRFRQWGKEKIGGGGEKTDTSEDFKNLELEVNARQEGMEKLQYAMNGYVKSLGRRDVGEGKDKQTPIAHLGTTMTKHGEEFEPGSNFGECLIGFGQANQRMARAQDSYATNASTSWLEACERSLAQMKDYRKAREKLESRRLAYDTSIQKMNKAKRDDYRVEEEVRAQKAKYEESTEDVYRRMQDIVEAESDNITELYAFLEAEITYHDRCREVLLQLKHEWPGPVDSADELPLPRRPGSAPRSRTNTLSRVPTTNTINEDSDLEGPPPILPFKSRTSSGANSPFQPGTPSGRPGMIRSHSNLGDSVGRPVISRTATESSVARITPRPASRNRATIDDDGYFPNAFEDPIDRSSSPATSHEVTGAISRNTSWSSLSQQAAGEARIGKKAPPPPPPNRASKPKPPPPPMKRSALSGEV